MKKLFISLLTVAATINAMAADYSAFVQLKVENKAATIISTENVPLMLVEKEGQTEGMSLYTQDIPALALYAQSDEAGTNKYIQLQTASLENMYLGMKSTSADAEYVLTVMYADGAVYKLKDLVTENEIELTTGETMEFSVTDLNAFNSGRFQIIKETPEVPYTRLDVTGGQWGTICYPASITEVQGGTLYSLTYADLAEGKVYAEEVTTATEAGKAYLFHADAEATQLVMPHTGDDAQAPEDTHGLVGTFSDTNVPAGAYGILNDYVVEIKEGNALKANRAYIKMEDLTSDKAPRRGRAIFKIANTPTNLPGAAAKGLQDGKFIMDGRFVIVKDGKYISALGL